jgi:hypothetical protein
MKSRKTRRGNTANKVSVGKPEEKKTLGKSESG